MKNFVMLVLLSLVTFSFAEMEPTDLLLKDGEVKKWKISDETACTKEIVNTKEDLFTLIDGGAQVFVDNGFKRGAFDGYKGGDGDLEVCIQVYDQEKPGSASKLFNELTDGWDDVKGIGDQARLEKGLFALAVVFTVKNFYVRVEINSTENSKQDILMSFGKAICKKVGINNNFVNVNILNQNGLQVSQKIVKNSMYFILSGKNSATVQSVRIFNTKGMVISTLKGTRITTGEIQYRWSDINTYAHGVYTLSIKKNGKTFNSKVTLR